MKKHLKSWTILTGIFFLILACQEKDGLQSKINQEIDNITGILAEEIISLEIQGGDETKPFGFRTSPEQAEVEFAKQLESHSNSHEHESIIERSKLISCLIRLDFTETQKREIRLLLLNMAQCRMEAFQLLRKDMVEIIAAMEKRRLDLLEKLMKQEISREQFHQGMLAIRETFKTSIEDLRKKHIEIIKPCIRETVVDLKGVLGEEKWSQLYSCMKD
ncbi:hypothetical protein [Cecembia rubra]|uniref:Lipoprotein n=1 Tax=Cecembia rubra TaxID=1485585 RepID=A0A2P8ED35_9BACT|nr:hypothetical protein [Cecembia rubra]PSL07386.1 hypothetical protein CLV48_101316 [Cecembia rubra]